MAVLSEGKVLCCHSVTCDDVHVFQLTRREFKTDGGLNGAGSSRQGGRQYACGLNKSSISRTNNQ